MVHSRFLLICVCLSSSLVCSFSQQHTWNSWRRTWNCTNQRERRAACLCVWVCFSLSVCVWLIGSWQATPNVRSACCSAFNVELIFFFCAKIKARKSSQAVGFFSLSFLPQTFIAQLTEHNESELALDQLAPRQWNKDATATAAGQPWCQLMGAKVGARLSHHRA